MHARRPQGAGRDGRLGHADHEEDAMDDKTKRAPHDSQRVNLAEDYELQYWSRTLGVSEERLRQLVHEHGHMVADIRRALGRA
jgi:hypothetical protein